MIGGEFLGLFVAPALAWRWLWVGPRVSGQLLREHGGQTAGMLVIEYVMLRLVKSCYVSLPGRRSPGSRPAAA